jgi:Protein of unknown function (DUF4230)
MPTDIQPVQHRSSRPVVLLLGTLLGITIAGLTVVALGGRALINAFTGQTTTVTASSVVRSIQQLQRLETVVYTIDQVVTEERTGVLRQPFAGDKILLIAHGDVVAGVELGQLSGNAVQVNGSTVRVRLPEARIFSTRLDNQKTRVYSRDTGLFTNPDPTLETEVRRRAETQLTAAAVQEGILQTARTNARQTLTALLTSLGFRQITIE